MRKILEFLKSNLWILPSSIVLFSVILAIVLIEVDKSLAAKNISLSFHWLLGAGANGARGMLSTIAASAVTVAGVVFSITMVVLSLASSQYSPRVLRNFMGDWKSQLVLGGFLGIFAYCLVVVRSVRGEDHDAFVPSTAVLVSLNLALVGIGLLIYFIHHIASSIRATSIVYSVYKDTVDAIDEIYPDKLFAAALETADNLDNANWFKVLSTSTGYLQSINLKELCKIARANKLTIKVDITVGTFVVEGNLLASISGHVEDKVSREINAACTVDKERTLKQDVGFGIRQLVDVGLKGLSPGINDTTTANFCIDYLGAIVTRLADRALSGSVVRDGSIIRVIVKGRTFESFLSSAFDQLRQNGERNPAVLLRIVNALNLILKRTAEPSRIAAIHHQISHIREIAERNIPARDRTELSAALA